MDRTLGVVCATRHEGSAVCVGTRGLVYHTGCAEPTQGT